MLRDEERQTQRKTGHRERRKKYRETVSCKHTRVCTRTHTQAHPGILGISQCSRGPISRMSSGFLMLGTHHQGLTTLQAMSSPLRRKPFYVVGTMRIWMAGVSEPMNEQLLVGTLGDESGAGKAQPRSISKLQRPRVVCSWGDGSPGKRTGSEAKLPKLLVPPPRRRLESPRLLEWCRTGTTGTGFGPKQSQMSSFGQVFLFSFLFNTPIFFFLFL